jgi:F0F1-type ATP synthase gamma subunit
MRIKNVVKVMNFHSLLRVEKAKKKAEKYRDVGEEITDILRQIMYNKNLILDKKVLTVDESKPILNIYLANDYGFCGDFNASIRRQMKEDSDCYKIVIGSKITVSDDKIVLKISKEDFYDRFYEIERVIYKALDNMEYSELNLYYNHYNSSSSFSFKKVRLFPIEFSGEYYEGKDFVAETDPEMMIRSLVGFYICYQLRMCESISLAAENLNRSQITKLALDKIEEKEEEIKNDELREKNEKNIAKTVENFKKISREE